MVAREETPGLAQPRGHDVEDRPLYVRGDLLLEAGDGRSGLADDFAGVGRHGAVEELHDRTLAGAVPSEQTDALPPLDGEVGPIEDGRTTERDADVLHPQQRHDDWFRVKCDAKPVRRHDRMSTRPRRHARTIAYQAPSAAFSAAGAYPCPNSFLLS